MSNLARLETTSHLPPELQPRLDGVRYGVTFFRRLRQDVARSWPFFERACREAGLARSVEAVALALFETASESRPSTAPQHEAEGRRAIVEEALAKELRKGQSLKLAAALVGVPLARVQAWCRADPDFAARIDSYRRFGVAQVHGWLLEQAKAGETGATVKLLEYSGEPEYIPRAKIQEPDEGDVLRSRAWARIGARLTMLLCPSCAARLAEELGS